MVVGSSERDWKVEDFGGFYSFEANETIRFWSNGGGMTLYKEFKPTEDFNVSIEAKVTQMGTFGLTHDVFLLMLGEKDNNALCIISLLGSTSVTISKRVQR